VLGEEAVLQLLAELMHHLIPLARVKATALESATVRRDPR
jgi:hypothetical protein